MNSTQNRFVFLTRAYLSKVLKVVKLTDILMVLKCCGLRWGRSLNTASNCEYLFWCTLIEMVEVSCQSLVLPWAWRSLLSCFPHLPIWAGAVVLIWHAPLLSQRGQRVPDEDISIPFIWIRVPHVLLNRKPVHKPVCLIPYTDLWLNGENS